MQIEGFIRFFKIQHVSYDPENLEKTRKSCLSRSEIYAKPLKCGSLEPLYLPF
jgi:hypothetical protein